MAARRPVRSMLFRFAAHHLGIIRHPGDVRQWSRVFGIIGARCPCPGNKHMTLRNIPVFLFAACLTLVAASALAAEGNAAAGKQKRSMCEGCHGIPMYRTAFPEVYSVPKLGGQHAAYIVKALQEYKSKDRSHPSMRAIAASLSDQDMADLAAYYGSPGAKPSGK